MPHIDHHSKPYDEGTFYKLEIFERYVEAWLPTFIMQKHVKEVNIVDFFAGIGYDNQGNPGSPIRILNRINSFIGILFQNHTIINLYFNEFKTDKFKKLINHCNNYLETNAKLKYFVKIHYSNLDFNNIYKNIIVKTSNYPNLYIIDQSGIKFTSKENFDTLSNLEKTDFLFFISSSYFTRFGNRESFKKNLDIDIEAVQINPYNFIHRVVLNKYRSLISEKSSLRIFPFSIKKGANIHGIIFGSKHILGVEKFLQIAWNKNKLNGEANYDIDEDIQKDQFILDFDNSSSNQKLTKIESFQKELEKYLKKKKVVTNIDLYFFTYENGHIRKHTDEHLRELKNQKTISYSGSTKISWNQIKKKNTVKFKLL